VPLFKTSFKTAWAEAFTARTHQEDSFMHAVVVSAFGGPELSQSSGENATKEFL